MNDHNLIKILKRSFDDSEPTDAELRALRKRVFDAIAEPVQAEGVPSPFFDRAKRMASPFPLPKLVGLFAVMLVAFGIAGSPLVTETSIKARIALAGNAHERSARSLTFADESLAEFTRAEDKAQVVRELLRRTSVSRSELDQLNLMGDPGKYTLAECLEDYQRYDRYLDQLDDAITLALASTTDPKARAQLYDLHSYVADSEKEAHSRIDLYPEGSTGG